MLVFFLGCIVGPYYSVSPDYFTHEASFRTLSTENMEFNKCASWSRVCIGQRALRKMWTVCFTFLFRKLKILATSGDSSVWILGKRL